MRATRENSPRSDVDKTATSRKAFRQDTVRIFLLARAYDDVEAAAFGDISHRSDKVRVTLDQDIV